jgi:hypothetical protein
MDTIRLYAMQVARATDELLADGGDPNERLLPLHHRGILFST